jgi:hypothetical protein
MSFFILFKLKLQYFVQESAAKFTIFYLGKKKFFKNLVFLTETVADLAVRYTFCGRYTLCAHCKKGELFNVGNAMTKEHVYSTRPLPSPFPNYI